MELDSPKTFRTTREEQERADDRRDAAQEMITLNRLGKRALRCKILVRQLHGRCQMCYIMRFIDGSVGRLVDMPTTDEPHL